MNLLKFAGAVLLTAALWANVACDSNKAKTETTETAATPAKVTDQPYVCPMRCEGSASNKPGTCVICSMDLEKNPDYVAPTDATTTQAPADSLKK